MPSVEVVDFSSNDMIRWWSGSESENELDEKPGDKVHDANCGCEIHDGLTQEVWLDSSLTIDRGF